MLLKQSLTIAVATIALTACGSSRTHHEDQRQGELGAADAVAAPQDAASQVAAAQALAGTVASNGLFLKIDGIDGESVAKGFEKQIELKEYSWSESNAARIGVGPGGGNGAGKVVMDSFVFKTVASIATPKLVLDVANGTHVAKATLTVVASGRAVMTWDLTNLLITSYGSSDASGDGVPTDDFKVDFSTVKVTYTPATVGGKPGTPVSAGWDVTKNRSL